MTVYEDRASIILYNLLQSAQYEHPFILPANICPVVPLIFLKSKTPFIYLDINSTDLCLDEERLLDVVEKRGGRVSGILSVRTYGTTSNPDDVYEQIKQKHPEILLIDDRCLCKPSFDRHDGPFDVELYSTGYSKFVDLGYGGHAILEKHVPYKGVELDFDENHHTNQIQLISRSIETGSEFRYSDSNWLGDTSRIIEPGDYSRTVLKERTKMENHKAKINRIYDELIPEKLKIKGDFHSWRYTIICDNKTELLDEVFKNDLFASSHYPVVGTLFEKKVFPVSEDLFSKVVNLFNDFRFDEDMAFKVGSIVKKWTNS